MGLSICRSIIDAHGGRLWADANEPRGAVFQFTLRQSGCKEIGGTRRGFLAGGLSLAAVEYFWAKALANTDRVAARTIAIWQGCAEAAKTGAAYDPGPGDFTVYPLHLPEGVRLVGKRGQTVLRSADGRPIVVASKLRSLLIEGIAFHGGAKSANSSFGLIHFEDVETFQLHGAEIADHDGVGVANLRSGGEVLGCTIHDIGDAGYHSTDGLGVAFGRDGDGNRIRGCGNAGVRIWTAQPWIHDGSTIRNNNISKVRSEDGGTGQNGNGVSIFRAADVTVEDNDIDECAFSAVRNNGGKDFRAARNRCSNLGERAMYAEFDFKNAAFENNTIATAAAGISLTNFDRARNVGCGGRAVGNEISHIVDEAPDSDWMSNPAGNAARVGVEAEGDILVEGNQITGPLLIGIECGFGKSLRTVICRDNTIRGADYGIAFTSLAPPEKPTEISGNHIVDAKKARIVATRYGEVLAGDLFGKASDYAAVHIAINYES